MTKSIPWSLQDQLDLIGRRGTLPQKAAHLKYAVRKARAAIEAQRSTDRHGRKETS